MSCRNQLWILVLIGLISSCDKRSKSGNSTSPENIVISSKGDESKLNSYPKDGTILIDVVLGEDGKKHLRLRNGMFYSVRLQVGNEKIEVASRSRGIFPLNQRKPERFRIWSLENGEWKLKYANVMQPEVSFHMAINHKGIEKIPLNETDNNSLEIKPE